MYRFYINNIENDYHYAELARVFLADDEFEVIGVSIPENGVTLTGNSYIVNRSGSDDREEIKHDIFCFEVRSGDSFLLCSDGFWEPVTEEDMTGLLKNSNSPEKWLKKMSELAVKNSSGKSMDNYTAIAVTVKG